jgi:hypothetical protein
MTVVWLVFEEVAISFKSFNPYTPRLLADNCDLPLGSVVESTGAPAAAPDGSAGVPIPGFCGRLAPIGDPPAADAPTPLIGSLPGPGDPPEKSLCGAAMASISTFNEMSSPFFGIALSN